jgi:hypothetical protein
MNSTREKETFWSLLVINPLLILLFTDVSLPKDIKAQPIAQLQTNLVPAQRGPASMDSGSSPAKQYHPESSSWTSPMAFEYEKPDLQSPEKATSLDEGVEVLKK